MDAAWVLDWQQALASQGWPEGVQEQQTVMLKAMFTQLSSTLLLSLAATVAPLPFAPLLIGHPDIYPSDCAQCKGFLFRCS